MKSRVLIVTNLFCFPWDSNRGVFNQQQFKLLGNKCNLHILVGIPWLEVLRNFKAYFGKDKGIDRDWPKLKYFIYFYPPGFAYKFHPHFYFVSMLLQRPVFTLFFRYDVIVGSWIAPDGVAATWLAKIKALPVVLKAHGSDINNYLHDPNKRRLIVTCLEQAHRVVTVSADLKNQISKAGIDSNKIKVIYNGVNSDQFLRLDRTSSRLKLDLDPKSKIVLFVGNLKETKGVRELILATHHLHSIGLKIKVIFLGDSPLRTKFEFEAKQLLLETHIRFEGKIPHAQLNNWFSAADLLCLPSYSEGVPNVILEAMAAGLPVVATGVGGIPEVLPTFAGIMVPTKNVSELSASIKQCLELEWDSNQITEYARRFDWNANAQQMLAEIEAAQNQRN